MLYAVLFWGVGQAASCVNLISNKYHVSVTKFSEVTVDFGPFQGRISWV